MRTNSAVLSAAPRRFAAFSFFCLRGLMRSYLFTAMKSILFTFPIVSVTDAQTIVGYCVDIDTCVRPSSPNPFTYFIMYCGSFTKIILYQILHFFSGFIFEPKGQLNTLLKVSEFASAPFTRNLSGECGFVMTWNMSDIV